MSHQDITKPIGFWRGWSISVGCTIGSGIFMMPTMLAPYGLLGILGLIVAGLGSILIALTLSRLSKRIPRLGGPYVYVHQSLGDFPGFLVAWTYWIACIAAVATIAIAFVGYLSFFLPNIANINSIQLVIALVLIWIIIFLNIQSIENSARFQVVTNILKLLPLLLIIVLGILNMEPSNVPELSPQNNIHPIMIIATCTTLSMWSYLGIETASVPADNIVEPEKTIPKVLIISALTVLIVYLLVTLAITLLVPSDELQNSTAPFSLAASKVIGSIGASVITMGALISTLGAMNANVLTAGNIALAAAKDGLFPSSFSKVSKAKTPMHAYLISGAFITVLLALNYTKGLMAAFTYMAMLSTLSTLIAYGLCAISDIYAVKKDPAARFKYIALFLSALTLGYVCFTIWGSGQEVINSAFILIAIGIPIYIFLKGLMQSK